MFSDGKFIFGKLEKRTVGSVRIIGGHVPCLEGKKHRSTPSHGHPSSARRLS